MIDSQPATELQTPAAPVVSVGGVLPLVPLSVQLADERKAAEAVNNTPVVQGLAAHVRQRWTSAWTAKQTTIENRMLQCLRQKQGEYDPELLQEIEKQGGSKIYMGLSSVKARAAASWLRDVLLGARDEKPWVIEPTPLPDLSPEDTEAVKALAVREAMDIETGGQPVTPEVMQEIVDRIKSRTVEDMTSAARKAAEQMSTKMEDQLVEGGFQKAMSEFIEDLVTFPSAFMKGPVIRKRPQMQYNKQTGELEVKDTLKLEWERVDPFMVYSAPAASSLEDGDLIERHRLTRSDLNALIGVEGYKDAAIRAVLDAHGRGGLHEWLWVDSAKAIAEGKSLVHVMSTPDTIDALQFWGSVQGKMLIEFGLDEAEVEDPTAEYNVEVWLVDRWVIKATINPDPMGRKPYYKASFEEVPGAFWGKSVMDLVRDCQTMCNSAARALANNMGIASGPQVWVNVDRLPAGEDITQMYPWKTWQVTSDPFGSTAPAVDFFVPPSLAAELMGVFEKFSFLADEYSGIPRYMTGETRGVGGAAGTASGMSMMMSNAGKAMKQVVAYVDVNVLQPLIERLYQHNMRYSDDKALKGDVNIVARGANALIVKEQAAVRRNEFLQIALSSPVVGELVGMEGVGELLRESAKVLDLDVDKIVPPTPVIRQREQQKQMMQMQMMAMQAAEPTMGKRRKVGSGQQLMSGGQATNNFQDRAK